MDFESNGKIDDNQTGTIGNRKVVFKKTNTGQFNFHLGVLLFAPFLNQLADKGLGFIGQWLVSVLLGCQNIEQGKKLNYTSLVEIIGAST